MVVCYLFAFPCAMITSALRSFCRHPFFNFACHSLSYIISCMMNYLHKLKRISTSTTCHMHLHSKSKLLICTSSGGALATYEDNTLSFTISHTSFPLKTSTSLSSITKKGEIVSASSATPSWFWSIDDKVG